MADYIKREDAIFVVLQRPLFQNSMATEIRQIKGIDLVMCRECCWARSRTLPGETGYECLFHRIWKGENGYCDNGERNE